MELIIALIVIAVLCVVLGVKPIYLLMGATVLLALAFVFSVLLLTFFFVRMLFAKRHTAVFSRIDKSPYYKFRVAYYMIEDREYPNIFPEEGFFRSKLYKSDKPCIVLLARNKKFVFDKFACATCTIGTFLGIACAAAAASVLIR